MPRRILWKSVKNWLPAAPPTTVSSIWRTESAPLPFFMAMTAKLERIVNRGMGRLEAVY
jgi:hypothetical protein